MVDRIWLGSSLQTGYVWYGMVLYVMEDRVWLGSSWQVGYVLALHKRQGMYGMVVSDTTNKLYMSRQTHL